MQFKIPIESPPKVWYYFSKKHKQKWNVYGATKFMQIAKLIWRKMKVLYPDFQAMY